MTKATLQSATTIVGSPRQRGSRAVGVPLVGSLLVALAAIGLTAQQKPQDTVSRRLTSANGAVVRGPLLRAVQVLEQRPIGVSPRVRFEWDQVRGAREYLLKGRWTGTVSWTIKQGEFRVTPRNATSWTPSRVVFETRLPEGSHSWKLLALFAGNDVREPGEPSLLSFAVK